MTTDQSSETPPEAAPTTESENGASDRPRTRRWLLGALVVAAAVTAAGAALNSAALALPGALVTAATVVAYDKTR